MILTIIIPAHNEEKTIAEVLRRVLSVELGQWEKEIVVVDDGSSDGTKNILESISSKLDGRQEMRMLGFKIIYHTTNLGKGSAIQTGLKTASGDYVIIQDADLEYDPADIAKLLLALNNITPLPPLTLRGRGLQSANLSQSEKLSQSTPLFQRGAGGVEVAVFGKRGFKAYPERGFHYVVGAWMLTTCYNLLFGQKLTDLYTGYKLIPTGVFKALNIESKGFEFEAEVACKLAKRGVIIKEVPINYKPRNKTQGKHIKFVDAVKGFWKIIKLRIKD